MSLKIPTDSQARLAMCVAVLGAIGATATARAQFALYSNGGTIPDDPGLATGIIAQSQVLARPGTVWSEVQSDGLGNANAVAGFAAHSTPSGGYRFADNFTVGSAYGWRVSMVSFFAYAPAAGGNASPVAQVNLRVWSGRPGDPGSTVVFGDTTTNRLVVSERTDIRRVFSSVAAPQPIGPDQSRPVWRIDADLGTLQLAPGTYWLDWQFVPANAVDSVFGPPVTVVGSRAKLGADARQFRATTLTWTDLVDPGKPGAGADVTQDLPFIVRGGVVPPPCTADFNGDGFTDGIDYDLFVIAFEQGAPGADVNGDGFIDGIDFDQFMAVFEQGC